MFFTRPKCSSPLCNYWGVILHGYIAQQFGYACSCTKGKTLYLSGQQLEWGNNVFLTRPKCSYKICSYWRVIVCVTVLSSLDMKCRCAKGNAIYLSRHNRNRKAIRSFHNRSVVMKIICSYWGVTADATIVSSFDVHARGQRLKHVLLSLCAWLVSDQIQNLERIHSWHDPSVALKYVVIEVLFYICVWRGDRSTRRS